MMNETEILERIRKIYSQVPGWTDVTLSPETRLGGKEEFSSLVLVELVTNIEDEFDIALKYSAIKSVKTVEDLIKLIREQL